MVKTFVCIKIYFFKFLLNFFFDNYWYNINESWFNQ